MRHTLAIEILSALVSGKEVEIDRCIIYRFDERTASRDEMREAVRALERDADGLMLSRIENVLAPLASCVKDGALQMRNVDRERKKKVKP